MLNLWPSHLRNHLQDRDVLIGCAARLGRGVLAALFPDKCLVCGVYIRPRHDQAHDQAHDLAHDLAPVADNGVALFETTLARVVCPRCIKQGVIPIQSPFCPCCGKPFLSCDGENHPCSDCITTAETHRCTVKRVRAFGLYDLLLKDLVHWFKYQKKICLARPLGRLMFHAFMGHFACSAIDLVIPVPLHIRRLRQRGFNQASLLVREFPGLWTMAAAHSPPRWSVSNTLLLRSRDTPSQTGFDRKNRLKNLKGAFSVKKAEKIEGQRILLIDDVYTTGATSGEAAQTLLDAGALSVDLLVLARA